MFLSRTPLFLVQDPLGDPPPSLASLSLSLCFYLGAVRAPLLKLLLKREHIQWGLSQSLSVSIKDPGNTTLSREPLLKGQWDPGSFATWVPAPPIPSLSWEKRKNTGIYAANQLFMNGMWTLQRCPRHRAPPSPAPSKQTQSPQTSQSATTRHEPALLLCAPHLMGIRHSSFYLHYSWHSGLFWLKRFVQTNSQTFWWHNPAYVKR